MNAFYHTPCYSDSDRHSPAQSFFVQPKLRVNEAGDRYEQEADAMADKVMRMHDPSVQQSITGGKTGLQRKCAECEEEEKGIQRKEMNASEHSLDTGIDSYISNLSGGHPLPDDIRSFYEPRFGYDFSQVKLHTDSVAAKSAHSINALAYTSGSHIVFNTGQYDPLSTSGKQLLAHELTHVVQQSSSAPAPAVQRAVFENNFPGGGRVDSPMPGEKRLWNFDLGKSALKPEHQKEIPAMAKEIKGALDPNNSEEQVDIEGQASSTGTAARNEELAMNRALSVKKALVGEGVPENKIRITVVGESKSEAGATQESFARSRAVRVITVPRVKMNQPAQPPAQTGCRPGLPNGNDLRLDVTGDKVNFGPEGPFVVLRAGTTTTPGMEVTAASFMTPPRCGKFSFIQNVMSFRQIIYKDGSRNTFQTQGFALDGGDPYHCTSLLGFFVADDGPGMGVSQKQEPDINTIEVREDFRTFLMFQPDNGARRTHQVAEWRWVGQVVNDDTSAGKGKLNLDNSISRITPQAGRGFFTGEAPVLSPNIADVPFVTDLSANPSKDSLAAKLVDGLNRARPKVKKGNVCSLGPAPPAPKPSGKLTDKDS